MFFGEYRGTFLLGINQKVGLLDYQDVYVQFLQILSSSYPKWFHHYTLSLAMYGKFYLLHIIADIWHCLFHFSRSGCYALVYHNDLICVSLVTKEIEHLFIFLWTVWISPCIFSIFLPVFSSDAGFSLLICGSYFYILFLCQIFVLQMTSPILRLALSLS